MPIGSATNRPPRILFEVCSRRLAINALAKCQGDVEKALNLLMQWMKTDEDVATAFGPEPVKAAKFVLRRVAEGL